MDVRELYQEVLLDHSRRPRNFGALPEAQVHVCGDNPNCGDEVTVHVKLDGEQITDIKFEGQGCAISQASASMMTLKVKKKSKEDVMKLIEAFQEMLVGAEDKEPDKELGQLSLLKGVREFPQRVKCATLAWNALKEGLLGGKQTSTEDED